MSSRCEEVEKRGWEAEVQSKFHGHFEGERKDPFRLGGTPLDAGKVLATVPSLDVAFLLNVTNTAKLNSKEVITMKEELILFVESLFHSHPMSAVRVSFVTCDDFCPAFYHAEFVSSPDMLVAKVQNTHCMPVLSALHTLSSLDWRADVRLLFHVDYKAYKPEDMFHEDTDDFVLVKQRPLIIAQLLSDLERKGISYHFIPMTI